MGSFSIWHWLIVLLIVVLVFGTKKLRNMGSDVGGAVKNFKDAMGEEKAGADSAPLNTIENDTTPNLIEAEVVQTPAVKAAPRKRATSAKTTTTTKPKTPAKPKTTTTIKAK